MSTRFYVIIPSRDGHEEGVEVDPIEALDILREGGIIETERGTILDINDADALEDALDRYTS